MCPRAAEMAAMTRDELIEILTEIVHATRARLSEARPGDGLKAAEMLAKMCGWNEPEKVNVRSVEVRVDAALIEQLRAGYTQLSERSAKACLPLPDGAAVADRAPAGGYASQLPRRDAGQDVRMERARASQCAKRRSKGRRGPHRAASRRGLAIQTIFQK
jgi:hypothetical protein